MIKSSFSLSNLLILSIHVLLSLTPTTVSAQDVVNIINADRVRAVQSEQGLIRKLNGNVTLRTRDADLKADSAWHYVDLGEIHGFSDVSINTSKETIFSDFLRYDINNEISTLQGNVIIANENTKIYSESALYSFLTEIALFNDPIWMQDSTGFMRANSGVYFNQNDSVVFFGNVQLADSTQYIEADSMFTSRRTQTYELFGNVYIQSLENRTDIKGKYVYADSTGKRIISDGASLRRFNTEATDTTWLTAAYIEMNKFDTLYVIDAIGMVESYQKENSAVSDTLHYDERTGLFNLISNPSVWYKNIQLTGYQIDIYTENDSLKTLFALGNAFAVQEDSVSLRFNQMKGDSITVYFADNEVDFILTDGNAELILHYTDDEDNPDGAVTVRSRYILIYFEDGDAADLKAVNDIQGETLSESDNPEALRLDGFLWTPERRPVRPEIIFEPRLDPIPTAPPFIRNNFQINQ